MYAKFEEATKTNYPEGCDPEKNCPPVCPRLIAYYKGGGGRLLTVDKNVDFPMQPLGRFVKYELPEPLPSQWKYAEKLKSLPPKYKKNFLLILT